MDWSLPDIYAVEVTGLFHDIGHQLPGDSMDGWGTQEHEEVGAQFLKEQGFSHNVCEMVRSHIEAKRYLCTDPVYYAQLSEGSKQSMRYQGAPMSKLEAEAFRQDPLFEQKLNLRHCDDKAKDPDGIVPIPIRELTHVRAFCSALLAAPEMIVLTPLASTW